MESLSEKKLDERMAALPHLKDLDLSHAATNMSPSAYRGIKEVMLLRERVLQEVPKLPPSSEHECLARRHGSKAARSP